MSSESENARDIPTSMIGIADQITPIMPNSCILYSSRMLFYSHIKFMDPVVDEVYTQVQELARQWPDGFIR